MAELWNEANGLLVARDLQIARTPWARTIGWLGRGHVAEDQALLLRQCHAIHTMFMRFCIDVVFLDDAYCILGIHSEIRPMRLALSDANATHTLELAPGHAAQTHCRLGDHLHIA